MKRGTAILCVLVATACANSTTRDDVDASSLDGSALDGSTSDGSTSDGNTRDGSAPDGNTPDGSASDSSVSRTIEELPAVYASAFCAQFVACYGEAANIFFREYNCEEYYAAVLRNAFSPALLSSAEDGSATFHGDQLDACAAALRAAACSDVNGPDLPACAAVFEGHVSLGGACTSDAACAGDAFCLTGGTCPATCAPLRALGSGCEHDNQCQSNYCSNATSTCDVRSGLGEACDAGESECAFGLLCLGANSAMARPGECRDPATLFTSSAGNTCNLDNGPWCADGLSCTVVQTAPVVRLECQPPSTSGSACGFGVPDACPAGEYCDADIGMGDATGVCRPVPGDGDPCAAGGVQPSCRSGMACGPDDRCHTIHNNGEPCSFDSDCYTLTCVEGTCSAPSTCS